MVLPVTLQGIHLEIPLLLEFFSKFTCSLLESRIKAKKVSQPFLRKCRASMAEIIFDIGSDRIPCTVTSDRSEHLNMTIFLSQSTMAQCLDNQSILDNIQNKDIHIRPTHYYVGTSLI